MRSGPFLGCSDEGAAYPSMPGVLRDDERGQPCNIALRMDGGECVGGSHSDDPALQFCDEGYCAASRREACQTARKISSVGWIPELPKQTGQGRCVAVRRFANDH